MLMMLTIYLRINNAQLINLNVNSKFAFFLRNICSRFECPDYFMDFHSLRLDFIVASVSVLTIWLGYELVSLEN